MPKGKHGYHAVCSIDGCDRSVYGDGWGWCDTHYRRWRRHGDPLQLVRTGGTCTAEGCDRAVSCRRFCATHYTRWQRHGDPLVNLRPGEPGTANSRRHARLAAATTAPVADREIFDRDGWVCQLCDQPVDPSLPRRHPMGASLDHRVPLVLGGLHCPDNVQLAHLRCNFRKGSRLGYRVMA